MVFWRSKQSEASVGVFDTHGHLTLPPFDDPETLELVMNRSRRGAFPPEGAAIASGLFAKAPPLHIEGVVVPGTSVATSRHGVALCKTAPLLHAAVGVHPNGCHPMSEDDWTELESLANDPSVVAIGETGLDLYWPDVAIVRQQAAFERHLDLAQRRHLPVLIHCREAWRELSAIVRDRQHIHGVVHAFSGDTDTARLCLNAGLYISFAGSLTYKAKWSAAVCEAARYVSDDKMLIETDAPYLVPHDLRDKLKTNEPLCATFVAAKIAELRNQPLRDILNATTRNAKTLFGL